MHREEGSGSRTPAVVTCGGHNGGACPGPSGINTIIKNPLPKVNKTQTSTRTTDVLISGGSNNLIMGTLVGTCLKIYLKMRRKLIF